MIAEIAQQVERRVEGACVGGSKPSLGTKQNLVSSAGSERRSTKPEAEAGRKGLLSRALCLPRGASSASMRPARRTFESCTRYQQRRASSTGRAAASKAEGSRFDSVVRCQDISA